MGIKQENWTDAARRACNLSELELTLGEVAGAVGDAEQSVTYADRSGDAGWAMITHTTHADALHQAGRRAEAEACFREAEALQAESQPAFPLLYSVSGFQYCDLLLTEAERAAWLTTLDCGSLLPLSATQPAASALDPGMLASTESGDETPADASRLADESGSRLPQSKALRDVEQRAAKTLKIAEDNKLSLLTIALDHLTLGRAAFYARILDQSQIENRPSRVRPPPRRPAAIPSLRPPDPRLAAVCRRPADRCRERAGRPGRGLGNRRARLDEALPGRHPPVSGEAVWIVDWRLPIEERKYPWESPAADLAAAERLIHACGYHRRDEELAAAKAALNSTFSV